MNASWPAGWLDGSRARQQYVHGARRRNKDLIERKRGPKWNLWEINEK